jgi:hypothetical protein
MCITEIRPTQYDLTTKILNIRSGFFLKYIPFSAIKKYIKHNYDLDFFRKIHFIFCSKNK